MGKRRRAITAYTVKPYYRSDRGRYQLKAIDNKTRKIIGYRTLPQTIRRESEAGRFARDWEAELERDGIAKEVGWDVASDRFAREYMAGQSVDYRRQWKTVSGKIASSETPPETIYDLDAGWFSSWVAELFEAELAPASVRNYLTMAGVFARWAGKMWPAYKPPMIDLPPGGNDMRGRPICGEELDRILEKLPEAVGAAHAASWRFLVRGLYLSGLRRSEALKLRYDAPVGDEFHIRYLGHRSLEPVFVITSRDDKGRRAREFPIAPEFSEFLLAVPEKKRTGFVFNPTLSHGRVDVSTLTRRVSEAAKLAGVIVGEHTVVDAETGKKSRVTSCASPHDLRRSFGDRGADRWPEMILMEMMRHTSIETTRRYYRGKNAQRTARVVREIYERELKSGNDNGDQIGDQTARDGIADKRKV